MIIELEINGARVIISGDNLTVNMTQEDRAKGAVVARRTSDLSMPSPEDIKELREKLGYRQAAFARLFRISQATVSRWETGVEKPLSLIHI